ncbi:hypothetical protein GCM10023238_00520 [Streptomyces heliomycini]
MIVPRDAVAHIHADLADAALRMMERNMGARVCDSDELWNGRTASRIRGPTLVP